MYYSLLLRSRDRYGTGDFWCRLECETGSYQIFVPFRVVGGFGNLWNISWCLDLFTVFSANFIESFFLLAGSISSFRSLHPFSYSLPVIVATAFLWTLERERDCLLVIVLSTPDNLPPNGLFLHFSRISLGLCYQHQVVSFFWASKLSLRLSLLYFQFGSPTSDHFATWLQGLLRLVSPLGHQSPHGILAEMHAFWRSWKTLWKFSFD